MPVHHKKRIRLVIPTLFGRYCRKAFFLHGKNCVYCTNNPKNILDSSGIYVKIRI